jgi:hypothetical protein
MWGEVNPSRRGASIEAADSVLHGLASDALQRYTTAFGGKESFLREVYKDHFSPADLPPVLRGLFEEFAKRP